MFLLIFTPNVFLTGDDKRIKIWDLAEGNVIADLKGHCDSVLGLHWVPGCDGIASFSSDGVVRTWGLNTTLGYTFFQINYSIP